MPISQQVNFVASPSAPMRYKCTPTARVSVCNMALRSLPSSGRLSCVVQSKSASMIVCQPQDVSPPKENSDSNSHMWLIKNDCLAMVLAAIICGAQWVETSQETRYSWWSDPGVETYCSMTLAFAIRSCSDVRFVSWADKTTAQLMHMRQTSSPCWT